MKYNTVYDDVNYDYPQCGGYVVKQSPDQKTVLIEVESNYQGSFTGRKIRIVYDTPVSMDDCNPTEIQSILDDPRSVIVKRGWKVQ